MSKTHDQYRLRLPSGSSCWFSGRAPFRDHPHLTGNPIKGAVQVTDDAESPVLAPGQIVFVEALRPRGANYFQQVFAVRYRGRVLVRHTAPSLQANHWRLFGFNESYRNGGPGEIKVKCPDGWPKEDWATSGRVHPELQLIGPAMYPNRFASKLQFGFGGGRKTPRIFFAWSN